jgi:hypothetical protein
MFAQPHRLRRFAAQVLLVWLFGLGTAIVNACVVHPGPRHGAAFMAQVHDREAQLADPADMQSAGDDHECDHSRPPCERLCDGPSAVPSQAEKQQSNPLGAFWLAAAPIPSFNFQSRVEPHATLAGAHDRWRTTVPIPIAFLRLTL